MGWGVKNHSDSRPILHSTKEKTSLHNRKWWCAGGREEKEGTRYSSFDCFRCCRMTISRTTQTTPFNKIIQKGYETTNGLTAGNNTRCRYGISNARTERVELSGIRRIFSMDGVKFSTKIYTEQKLGQHRAEKKKDTKRQRSLRFIAPIDFKKLTRRQQLTFTNTIKIIRSIAITPDIFRQPAWEY